MTPAWRRIRPGWYLLLVLLLYAGVVTILLRRSNAALNEASATGPEAPADPVEPPPPSLSEDSGVWFPIPGAGLPEDDSHLPGAVRAYRQGVSEGFDFYDGEVGVPVAYGTPVVAAVSGTLLRVDSRYREIAPDAWQALLDQVSDSGANEGQLDRLRGRQVWLQGDGGRVFRYAHLSEVRRGLAEGQRVYRGQVIGFVGNSGTDDGVQGSTGGARLHFEIWEGDTFFGNDLDAEAVRLAAASLFYRTLMDPERPAATPPGDPASTPAAERGSSFLPNHQVTAVEIVWRNPWVRAVTFVVLAVFLVVALWRLRSGYAFALQVGVIGYVIAYILNPLVERLGRLRIRRSFAVVLIYILVLLLLVLGSVLLGQVAVELSEFVTYIDDAFQQIANLAAGVSGWLSGIAERLPSVLRDRFGFETGGDELALQIQEQIATFLTRATEGVVALLERLVAGGPNLLLTGANRIISTTLLFFLILLASAYFLYDFPRFVANFRRFVPVRWRPLYQNLNHKADQAVGGYLRGQLLITTILGLLIWIGLSILDVRLALAISFLAAIFNLIPYLGPIIGVVPAVLLALIDSPWKALGVVVVFIVANQLEGNLLSPMILSRSVNLHPVTVLLAIMTGLGLLGFVGALLAVPFVALIKVVLEEFLLTRPAYAEGPEPAEADEDRAGAAEA